MADSDNSYLIGDDPKSISGKSIHLMKELKGEDNEYKPIFLRGEGISHEPNIIKAFSFPYCV